MTSEVLAQVQSRRFKVKALHQWALPKEAGGGAGTVTAQLHSCLCVLPFFPGGLHVLLHQAHYP